MSTDRTNFTSLDKYRRLELIKVKFKLTVLVKQPNMDCPIEKMFVFQLFEELVRTSPHMSEKAIFVVHD